MARLTLILFVLICAPASAAGWQRAPAPPLQPRESAIGLWTGSEALIIGGSAAAPCPSNASCDAPDEPPLRDGAAFDPRTRTWRRLARAPVGFEFAQGAVVGRTAYLSIPGSPVRPRAPRAFLGYRFDRDRWRRMPRPPLRDFTLLAAGDRLVASRSGGGAGSPGVVFDARTRRWSELPPAPLPRSWGRVMAWDGQSLVLFVPAPDSRTAHRPPVARAAAFDFATGQWRRLPDPADILVNATWLRAGSRLISPTLGTSNGGEVNGWGADYRNGGILDVSAGTWAPLPAEPGGNAFGIGVLTATTAHYFGVDGWVLDATTDRWLRVPRRRHRADSGATVVNAGRDLLVFGGARFDRRGGRLLRRTWTWSPSPRARSGGRSPPERGC